jgi:hypothetical protein
MLVLSSVTRVGATLTTGRLTRSKAYLIFARLVLSSMIKGIAIPTIEIRQLVRKHFGQQNLSNILSSSIPSR